MAYTDEFGIIDNFDENKIYEEYEPWKYRCISINGDIIDLLMNRLNTIKTYYHCIQKPNKGLARYGITLIPPESLDDFLNVIMSVGQFKFNTKLNELAVMIMTARDQGKYMIHFGV